VCFVFVCSVCICYGSTILSIYPNKKKKKKKKKGSFNKLRLSSHRPACPSSHMHEWFVIFLTKSSYTSRRSNINTIKIWEIYIYIYINPTQLLIIFKKVLQSNKRDSLNTTNYYFVHKHLNWDQIETKPSLIVLNQIEFTSS
jgi:hypothetical protein